MGIFYPPPKAEGYRFGVVRPAVGPNVCPIVQTCWGYIAKIITDLNMKLQQCIDFNEEKSTAQEP